MNVLKSFAIPALVAALIIGGVCPPAFAANHEQHTKPLRGIGTLRVVLAAGTIDCLAPDGSALASFPAEFDALARYTGLGRTVGTITVDSCSINPADGSLNVTGVAYQTAANGDEVHAPYVGTFQPDFSFRLDIEIAGGTGRFTNACGVADVAGMFDPVTGAGETWLDGWISTPGARGGADSCN